MTLAERIQALRKEKGLSQEELGERLGVARQSVSKWESGTTIPELDKLIAMSKLFGVSVGSILGLEEGETPDHELTDRELKALEAIARRLTPPQAEPKKRRRWPLVLAAVAVIGAGVFLMSRINSLENQIGGLHYNISNIDNTVSRQINSLTGQVRDILEEQNSVAAGVDYAVAAMDLMNDTVTFSLTATPREYREGMTAVFSATGDFEAVEAPGVLGAGQTFTGSLTCPLADDITLWVGFTTGESTVTQQLGQEQSRLSNTRLDVSGYLNWTIRIAGEDRRLSRLTAGMAAVTHGWYHDGSGWRELTLTQGELRLWKNDTVVWSEEREELAQGLPVEGVAIPVRDLELAPGDRLILSVLYTDSAGRREERWLDGVCVSDGMEGLESLAHPADGYPPAPWETGAGT